MPKPRVLTRCVANHHAGKDEKFIEFSFPGACGPGDCPLCGLIQFINDKKSPTVHVYIDQGVEVRVNYEGEIKGLKKSEE